MEESRGKRGLGQVWCARTTQSATNFRTGEVVGNLQDRHETLGKRLTSQVRASEVLMNLRP